MIRHHHKFIQPHVLKMDWDLLPNCPNYGLNALIKKDHLPLTRADSYEIRASRPVIIVRQAGAASLRPGIGLVHINRLVSPEGPGRARHASPLPYFLHHNRYPGKAVPGADQNTSFERLSSPFLPHLGYKADVALGGEAGGVLAGGGAGGGPEARL